jgi:hypothetical protein
MKKRFFLALLLLPVFVLSGMVNADDPCPGCGEPRWADRLLNDTASRKYWLRRLHKAVEALKMTSYENDKAVAYWLKVKSDPEASSADKEHAKEILDYAGNTVFARQKYREDLIHRWEAIGYKLTAKRLPSKAPKGTISILAFSG